MYKQMNIIKTYRKKTGVILKFISTRCLNKVYRNETILKYHKNTPAMPVSSQRPVFLIIQLKLTTNPFNLFLYFLYLCSQ